MSKILIIITLEKNEIDNVMAGLNLAYYIKVRDHSEEIKIILHGQSKESVVLDNKGVKNLIIKLINLGIGIFASKNDSDNFKINMELEKLGINVDNFEKLLTKYMRQGYIPMKF